MLCVIILNTVQHCEHQSSRAENGFAVHFIYEPLSLPPNVSLCATRPDHDKTDIAIHSSKSTQHHSFTLTYTQDQNFYVKQKGSLEFILLLGSNNLSTSIKSVLIDPYQLCSTHEEAMVALLYPIGSELSSPT